AAAAVDDELYILAVHAGAGNGAARCRDCELDAGNVRDAPLLHSGPRRDPLVVRGQECGQVLIRQNRRRQAFAPTDDGSVIQCNPSGWFHVPPLSPIWSRAASTGATAAVLRPRIGSAPSK